MPETYIYEIKEMSFPKDVDSENMFYYYKRETPKKTIEITHNPNEPAVIDIYNNPEYHDVDTDEEIDMDSEDNTIFSSSNETASGTETPEDGSTDLLSNLTRYLESLNTVVEPAVTRVPLPVSGMFIGGGSVGEKMPRRLTRKMAKGHNKRSTRANKAHPKRSY
jgi:hypothetical protein